MGRFEFLDAVAIADCALQIEGQDLDDLFETAVRALAELMVDPLTVLLTIERAVTLEAPSLAMLFYDWLSELIFVKDAEQVVFTSARVRVREGSPWGLSASLDGGLIVGGQTDLRSDPKAVTLHDFAVEPCERGWRARVVIDI